MSDQYLRIRPASPADLDSLVALLALLFAIERDFVFDAPRQRRGLALMLENERGCVLVAEISGRVVGMCTGQSTISTAEGGMALLVEDVVVHEEWRGQGIGRKLLAGLRDWAGARQIARLQLLADRNNAAALAFYQNLGWDSTELICLHQRLSP